MRAKDNLKLILVDVVGFFMSFHVCIPPVNYVTYELVCGQQDILPVVALHNLKFLFYNLEPVIDIHRLRVV
jgi:hypothetical protein